MRRIGNGRIGRLHDRSPLIARALHRGHHRGRVVAQQEAVGIQNDDVLGIARLDQLGCGGVRIRVDELEPLGARPGREPASHDRDVRVKVRRLGGQVREVGVGLALEQRDPRAEHRRKRVELGCELLVGLLVLAQLLRTRLVHLRGLTQDLADKERAGMVVGAAKGPGLDLGRDTLEPQRGPLAQVRRGRGRRLQIHIGRRLRAELVCACGKLRGDRRQHVVDEIDLRP